MELRHFFKIILRHKLFILLMVLSSVITAVLLTYVVSEKYKSSTSILVRPKKSINIVPKREEILNFPVSYYTSVETASKTYSEIIKSRVIAERVVNVLGLDRVQEDDGSGLKYLWRKTKNNVKKCMMKTWVLLKYGRIPEEDNFSSAVTEIMESLSVKPTKETYLFEVEAEARTPQMASAIANTSAKVFIEYMEELSTIENDKARKMSEEKIKVSERKLEESRSALVSFKEKHGIVSLKKEMNLHLEALSAMETLWLSIVTKITGIEARKKELRRQIAELEKFSKSTTKVAENPLIRELRSQLAMNEVKLARLSKRYTAEHREVQALLAENNEIREKLKQEAPTLPSEEMLSVDPVYQELSSEFTRVENDLESLKAERDWLTSAIREKKTLIELIPQAEAELARLELKVSLNEDTYKLLTKEYEELVLLAYKNVPNIEVIHSAVAPVFPFRPIKVFNAVLAGILSLIAGVGIALLMENVNITVRTIDEAERTLSMPVLMAVPRLESIYGNNGPLMKTSLTAHGQENRKDGRAYVQYPLEIRRKRDSTTVRGVSNDISSGGLSCYVETKIPLDPGEKVDVSLLTGETSGEKMVIEGTVLRSKNTIAGYNFATTTIQFENISSTAADRIRSMVRKTDTGVSCNLPSDFEEPVRGLRSDILFMNSQGMSLFLVTSCRQQEGKTTIISNLALSLAEINKKVIIIDANLRYPSLHSIYRLSNDNGLSDFLSSGAQLGWKKTGSGLTVLTSGSVVGDTSALLGSHKMIHLLQSLKNEFDIILFDSPPVLSGPDTAQLSSIVHGVIMVLSAGTTTIDDCRRARQILDRSNIKTLGIVLNNFEGIAEGYYMRSVSYET